MRCIVNKKRCNVNAMQRFVEHFGDTIDGTRTRTARKPGDFKSPASTDSATMALAAHCTIFYGKKQAMLLCQDKRIF